ncbi:MAG: NUDIX hydrolase [Clostridia bacterium]|nr:NUDIX hydrolase [Clostridia bacterium]
MAMTEKTIKTENIFNGRVINLNIETVELPNGNTSTREIVSHSGGVGILAVDNDKNAYMVTQFRSPYKKLVLEVPAGKLNKGESHLECGIRELREETGLEAEEMKYMGYILPSPGYTNEIIHLYLATGLKQKEQCLDEDEFLTVSKIPLGKLKEMCLNNEITDAKTVALVLKAYLVL